GMGIANRKLKNANRKLGVVRRGPASFPAVTGCSSASCYPPGCGARVPQFAIINLQFAICNSQLVTESLDDGEVGAPRLVLLAGDVLCQADVRDVARPARLAAQAHRRLRQVLVTLLAVAAPAAADHVLPG